MASRLQDIKFGHCTIEDLAYWINERHSIFVNRFEKELPKPWTDDPILQQYKFTNCFRQLDKGTLALRNMLLKADHPLGLSMGEHKNPALIFFNIVWYRLFNWHEHAENLGFIFFLKDLEAYIQKRFRTHKRIFTGAHMTTGVSCENKHDTYLRACREVWDRRYEFSASIKQMTTMEEAFGLLLELYMVGKFVAYEIICDLRFTPLLENAIDKLTWANMGPGAQRGLKRLGLPHKNQKEGSASMRKLYGELPNYLSLEILKHYYTNYKDLGLYYKCPPFELREVEHSLCEMDKYMRVKMNEGRPRSKYPGI